MTTKLTSEDIYISIDPGFRNMAFSVFYMDEKKKPRFVHSEMKDLATPSLTWQNMLGTSFLDLVVELHRWVDHITTVAEKECYHTLKYCSNPKIIIERQNNKKITAILSIITSYLIQDYCEPEDITMVYPQSVGAYYKLNKRDRDLKKQLTKQMIDEKFPKAKKVYTTHDQYDTALNFIYYLERNIGMKDVMIL